jgi:hypothetical protein
MAAPRRAALEGLLLDGGALPAHDRTKRRGQLLERCARDTMAMVKVTERLRRLAA